MTRGKVVLKSGVFCQYWPAVLSPALCQTSREQRIKRERLGTRLGAVLMYTDVRAHDRLVDCANSYTLQSFMLMKCHCLFVTPNSTSNRSLIFNVFSYTDVYASPLGVRSTSLSLRLVVRLLVSLVPTGAIFKISNTRPIISCNFY